MLTPPFCPNRCCTLHHPHACRRERSRTHAPWFIRSGFYRTRSRGLIQRFTCRSCRCGFSEQTFRLDYFTKRPISYTRVRQELCSCSGVRAASRNIRCSPGSYLNRISRLARQYISAHARILCSLTLCEPLAADGFESFTSSQFWPNNIHLLLGSRSQFLYSCDYAALRRKGAMTPSQKLLRAALEQLYRPAPSAIASSFARLCGLIPRIIASPLTLWTDCKREYSRVLASDRRLRALIASGSLLHRTVSSRAPRTTANPLFAVNYMDRQLRKDLAEHVRETVRFARNVNNSMERLWVYAGVHNYQKRYRSRSGGEQIVHAQVAGIGREPIERALRGLTTRRRFLSLEPVRGSARLVWQRMYRTPLKGVDRRLLREVTRRGRTGPVSVADIARRLGITAVHSRVREYLPGYVLT